MKFRYPVAEHPLLDAHCHGVVTDDLTDAEFEALSSESRLPAPPAWSPLDAPVGLAIRRWCAPALDLPAHAPIAEYLRRDQLITELDDPSYGELHDDASWDRRRSTAG
jgi:hypothetical protein